MIIGRAQQMSMWDVEKSVAVAGGKDFRSLKTRRTVFVTFVALLLPFLITSSYIYYNSTPDASTEAVMFVQRRPFSSFVASKADADTSLFENDTSDIQVESKTEDTENTEDSLGAKPKEISGNTEADSTPEDVEAEEDPADAMAENEERENLHPSESSAESGDATSSTLGFPEQKQANVARLENADVNATMTESGASEQKAPDDRSNNHQPEREDTENAKDSLGAKPKESGNTEADPTPEDVEAEEDPADAMAENEERENLHPSESSAESGDATSSTLGFPEQKQANVARLENADVNATMTESGASEQKAPDDLSNNHQLEREDTENAKDSLGAKPKESGNTEADPTPEDVEAEEDPADAMAENEERENLHPSESSAESGDATSSTLGFPEQKQANVARLENADVNATMTESGASEQKAPDDLSNNHQPEREDTKNAKDSLGAKPKESGNTEADSTPEDAEAEEAPTDATAENEEREKLHPNESPAESGNATSSALGFPEQKPANVTQVESTTAVDVNATMAESGAPDQKAPVDRSSNPQPEREDTENAKDSLGVKSEEGSTTEANTITENEGEKVNSTSQAASAVESDAWKQSESPDETPNNHQESQPSVLALESDNKGVCDLVKGKWVPDSRPPQYTNVTCRLIQAHQDCMKNGRPDMGYLHWKWQPEECDLPRIDAAAFLKAMRDKSMYFVGDSLARNQFQSLLCLLSQAEMPDHTYQSLPDDRDNVYVFPSHNFTIACYWSTRLMHVEDKLITWPDNSTEEVAYVHLDKLDEAWAERIPGTDFVQISTGQWWFKRSLYLLGGQPIGCHWWDAEGHTLDEWKECTKVIGFADPYRMAIHKALEGSLSIPGYTGTTILRSFAPDHFEDGEWDNGGQCVRTSPGGVPMRDLTKYMYDIQIQAFQNVTGALSASEEKRARLLDITNLAQIRNDGHPDAYRNFQPFSKESKQPVQKDCLHWCLPGPIDTWNELLVETLRQ